MNKKRFSLILLLTIYFAFVCVFESSIAWANTVATQEISMPAQLIAKGKAFNKKGDFKRAALAWKQALSLLDTEKDSGIYTDTAVHLAGAYQGSGYHQKALNIFQQALPVAEKSNEKPRRAMFFTSFGDLYLTLGNIPEAIKYLEKGLDEARSAENPHVLAVALINIGNMLVVFGDYDQALAIYDESLESANSLKNGAELKSKILTNVVYVTFLSGRYEETAASLDYALTEIGKLDDSHNKAWDMISLNLTIQKIRASLTQPDSSVASLLSQTAWRALNDAKRIAADLQDIRTLSYACGYMGKLYEDEGRYPDAIKLTRRAIFFAQEGDFPQILYLWQWQLGRLLKAGGDTEEAIKVYGDAISTLNPIRRELFSGYRHRQNTFDENIKPVYLGLAALLLEQAESMPDKASREKKLRQARDTMELLKTAELQDFFEDECVTAMKKKVTTVNHTPPHTAVLYPITLPDKLVLLLTLPDGMKQMTVPAGYKNIKETVRQFRLKLQTRPSNTFLYESQQLYDWLIRPIESELAAREVDTLVVAPDGALRTIPFSTLHDGNRFLVEKYAMGLIPAISLTDPKPLKSEEIKILLSGVSEGVQDFSPLPSVTAELSDIREIMGGKIVLQDKEYTIDNLTEQFKNQEYAVVHLATHGVFGGTPEESFLLTYDDKLTMNRLEQLISIGRFREQQVELLTLSACQTAMGNERAALGLAGVAVKAGVRSAIATLWFVDDEATSLAVREFYRQIRKPGMSKAKALQNSQKKLISQLRYWHPAYWAPFLLIGNWL
ncbi:CHAT domain-containing protein [Desulfonema magnum]|uniref:Tetratricopeptide repeat-containing protein, CHAT domain-containing n=1 Tax=Desulfonema magnum TaxID=45655 RepID=A0A975BEY0_9BACT|nr:CHAT domain-containing protein [Desulfonema magnum]QTA84035.1 Tetratricopeptide repeat-containing protein, CHAT domain-containing [Desulfonema magnum]